MDAWTVISDPATGMLFESRMIFNDASEAFRVRREDFRPLREETRALSTHDGCTVGDNVEWLTPGEWIASDGIRVAIGN